MSPVAWSHRELLLFREPVFFVYWLESSSRLGTVRSRLPSPNAVGQLHVLQATGDEVRYGLDTSNRVFSVARCETGRLFKYLITHHWTPHSGRCFMPSATAVMNTKEVRGISWADGRQKVQTDTHASHVYVSLTHNAPS